MEMGCSREASEVQIVTVHGHGHMHWDLLRDRRKGPACPRWIGRVAARGTIAQELQKSAGMLSKAHTQQVTSSE